MVVKRPETDQALSELNVSLYLTLKLKLINEPYP